MSTNHQLLSGNVGRVIDEKFGSGNNVATSITDDAFAVRSSSELFDVDSLAALFEVKSFFTSTKWWVLQLNCQELLRLWDYPD